MPWANTDRIVCADSYFAAVSAAEELWERGLRFIGVIKTATRKFLMAYLSNIEFQNWGDMSSFSTRPVDRTKPVLGDFVWMDWNRRYFIFTEGSMEKGRLYLTNSHCAFRRDGIKNLLENLLIKEAENLSDGQVAVSW